MKEGERTTYVKGETIRDTIRTRFACPEKYVISTGTKRIRFTGMFRPWIGKER